MSELLPRLVGPFRLEAKIGQGGMGVVYRATELALDRPVAVKMIALSEELGVEGRAQATQRFVREAKAAARIQSRHVAQVLQYGQAATGDLYIAMELLEGESLSKLLAREGRLSAARAVGFARQICRGLHVAHGLGVVHRDLKAPNIMVVSADGDDEVLKILDFGVAKLTAETEKGVTTQQGAVVGTLNTMAPEQIEGKTIDGRADVYALGVLLYRMLTGKPLFESSDLVTIIRHQLHTPPQPLRERAPDANIPQALADVVIKCLAKDPTQRPASMKELEGELALSIGIEVSDSWSVVSAARLRPTSLDDATLTPPTKVVAIVLPRGRSMAAAVGVGVAAVMVLAIVAVVLVRGAEPPPLAVAPPLAVPDAPVIVAPVLPPVEGAAVVAERSAAAVVAERSAAAVVAERSAAAVVAERSAAAVVAERSAVVAPVVEAVAKAPVVVAKPRANVKEPASAAAPSEDAPKLRRVRTKETP